MKDEMITMLNQTEIFGHEDHRLLFIIGRTDFNDEIIDVLDVRKEESVNLATSNPIQELTEDEIITEAKRIKSIALDVMNGWSK